MAKLLKTVFLLHLVIFRLVLVLRHENENAFFDGSFSESLLDPGTD